MRGARPNLYGQTCCGAFRKPTPLITQRLDQVKFGRAQRTITQELAPRTLRFSVGVPIQVAVNALVLCDSLILGLAVLALATVPSRKTGANAQTANTSDPNI